MTRQIHRILISITIALVGCVLALVISVTVHGNRQSQSLDTLKQLVDVRNSTSVGDSGANRIQFRNPFPSWIDRVLGDSVAETLHGGPDYYDLSNTDITDDGLRHFTVLTGARTLLLNNTSITDTGLMYLSACNLNELQLPNTDITDSGLAGLTGSRDLASLLLCHTRVTGKGCRHLSQLSRLKLLCLLDSECNDEGLAQIAMLHSVEELLLAGTKITDKGMIHLAKMPNLKLLSLRGTDITDHALSVLAKSGSLAVLDLENTAVSEDAIQSLLQALPRCQVRRPNRTWTYFPDRGK